ncbi:hypothetical protein [Roseovarius sp.]|uniref:hypothetical protein n=1 Tax=Roseovarius sp. TaxID=1486281 RepID=UPI002613CB54|nr:hypothetical protein [Roseovarius sp.]
MRLKNNARCCILAFIEQELPATHDHGWTKLANVSFILSTGRTSTQNIAAIAANAHPDAIVQHEGLGPNYFSRRVFRRPRKFAAALGGNIPLQRKFIEIEDALASGTPYLEVGWPAYAWLPYIADRFGSDFKFAHLVRNPFEVAASLTTHGLFADGIRRGNRFQRIAMIDVSDATVFHADIAANGSEFSPFERNLFHWLELNQFMLEQHGRDGFLGLFRFEDLYKASEPALPALLGGLLGKAELDLVSAPVDRVQKKLPFKISEPDPQLVHAVLNLAQRLGYSEEALLGSFSVDELNQRYSRLRL